MAAEENTNWSQSVTGIVIRDSKVLLARHTYGRAKESSSCRAVM